MSVEPELSRIVLIAMLAYVGVMLAIGWAAQRRISDVEDFVVAGRRLPLSLAAPTLLATWYGAGTLLAAADEVRLRGLSGATLDPLGAGLCLFIAGLVFAGPMWRMRLLTLPDLFARRFGPRAEVVSAVLMLPQYFGWIAAQFMALAGMLQLFFGLSPDTGVVIVCAVGVVYTLLGGMWAVTLTDALQMGLVVLGLGWMVVGVLGDFAGGDPQQGLATLLERAEPERLSFLDPAADSPWVSFVAVLAAGALGNLPSQDLMQRVFASRSDRVATRACLLAGAMYWLFGALPVLLGLAAHVLDVDSDVAVLPLLASRFLHPVGAVIFVLTLLSAILSTIDSALLAPATVLGQNVMAKLPALRFGDSPLLRTRVAIVVVAGVSLAAAFAGETAYGMLESAYELGMVSLLAPLVLGLFARRHSEPAILLSMASGTLAWLVHVLLGEELFAGGLGVGLPAGIGCMLLSLLSYPVGLRLAGR